MTWMTGKEAMQMNCCAGIVQGALSQANCSAQHCMAWEWGKRRDTSKSIPVIPGIVVLNERPTNLDDGNEYVGRCALCNWEQKVGK